MKLQTSKNPAFYIDPSRMTSCRKIKNRLEARVLGNDSYRVRIDNPGKRTKREYCSCPAFSNNGSCKHVVAIRMAYEKHPEWFEDIHLLEESLHRLPRKRLVRILELLFSSVPQARDIIEAELRASAKQKSSYIQKIGELFRSASMRGSSLEELYLRIGSFTEKCKQFYEEKNYFSCIQLCYEIVQGCLSLDQQWGSTEIFPECFVSEVWELYLKAVRKARLSLAQIKTVSQQIERLSQFESYLFDQEGVYPEQAKDILKKNHGFIDGKNS